MSAEKGGWGHFRVERASMNEIKRITRAALVVYWVLACRMNPEGWCWPSQAELGDKTGMSRRYLQRALKELEAKGWLHVQHSFGPPKWKHANHYRLLKYVSCGVQEMTDAHPRTPGSVPQDARKAHPGTPSKAHPGTHGTITNVNNTQGTILREQRRGGQRGIERLPTGEELEKAWKGRK